MGDPTNYPVNIETPEGPVTQEGTRQNARTLIEYVEGWLGGRGAKGIDRLAGRQGRRPALMEDLATARISVAQMAQRVIHEAQAEDTGTTHNLPLLKSIMTDEGEDIIRLMGPNAPRSSRATLPRCRQNFDAMAKKLHRVQLQVARFIQPVRSGTDSGG